MKTTLVIPDQMHARLELQSRRNGMNISEVIRAGIDFYLNYQDSFYDGETLKPPTGNAQTASVAEQPEKPKFTFQQYNPLTTRDLPAVPISPEERQLRIDRMATGGMEREESDRPSPFARKQPTP